LRVTRTGQKSVFDPVDPFHPVILFKSFPNNAAKPRAAGWVGLLFVAVDSVAAPFCRRSRFWRQKLQVIVSFGVAIGASGDNDIVSQRFRTTGR
jgi:hypothetical protein